MTDAITHRLSACYSGVLHDEIRDMGIRNVTLPPEIRPLFPERTLAGPVFTIEGQTGDFDPHETLLEWTGLLSKAKPGHIWISQPNDDQVSHMGELSAETLKDKGILGVVTDGFSRDINFILAIGLQVWSKGHTPRDIVGYWKPKSVDTPITIGAVTIHPGDYFFGDRDGALIIPQDQIEAVLNAAEAATSAENKVRTAILAGVDPQEAYLRHGKF